MKEKPQFDEEGKVVLSPEEIKAYQERIDTLKYEQINNKEEAEKPEVI